jgi:hypothetical protein
MSSDAAELPRLKHENEVRKESHHRRMEWFAAAIVGIAFTVSLSTVVFPSWFDEAARNWGQPVLTTILGTAIGYSLKDRQDRKAA